MLPELRALEHKYADAPFTVVGIHSAKFENEREVANVRNAVLRHEIRHPVVLDEGFRIWQSYGVRAWPTLVLLDPEGYVVGGISGEGQGHILDQAIGMMLEAAREGRTLAEAPLRFDLEPAGAGNTPLYYPGKVLADAAGGRLFIADTNHHRIVVTRLDGTLRDVIGSGEAEQRDGAFEEAAFFQPQGMAVEGDTLYVADTENHLLRRVDLAARRVATVAGTGFQARGRSTGGAPLFTPLNSPWDLCLAPGGLFIAMAGSHQIWRMALPGGPIEPFAGMGGEARRDGPAPLAMFAQPSGITTDGNSLYVADSEISCIRRVTLGEDPEVETVAGGDLFEFGDVDGIGDSARFQHPLGVAYLTGKLYVADAYNHKVRVVDPATREVGTLAGTGSPGREDGERPAFYEPGGISAGAGRLFLADTNNHAVRVLDPATGRAMTLNIPGLCPPGCCLPG